MTSLTRDIIEKLDNPDKKKVEYFIQLLLRQEKYKLMKEEMKKRRKEVERGEVLSHDDFWKGMNV